MRRFTISLLIVAVSLAFLGGSSIAQTDNVVHMPLVINGGMTGVPPLPTATATATSTATVTLPTATATATATATSTTTATTTATATPTPTTQPLSTSYLGEWQASVPGDPGYALSVIYHFRPDGTFSSSIAVTTPSSCTVSTTEGVYTADEETIIMDAQLALTGMCGGDLSPTSASDEMILWRATSNPEELHLTTALFTLEGQLFTRIRV